MFLDIYPVKLQLTGISPSALPKMHSHKKIFDISCTNVVNNILVSPLVRFNFELFKSWCFMFLLCWIRLMFLFVHISWTLCWCLFFLVIMLFYRYGQVNNWFCYIFCIFIWWDVISSNMEDKMIWFISCLTNWIWCTIHFIFVPGGLN